MNNTVLFEGNSVQIEWDKSSTIIEYIKESSFLEGEANNIKGEVFFYQYVLDIPFDNTEREVFEKGDVVYWRSTKSKNKFGILFMYGNTEYGDGTKPRTSSPGIKIGTIKDIHTISKIKTGSKIRME